MRCYAQPFVVVGAIIEDNGRILLVKEGAKMVDTGLWNQPAGWLDKGEDIIEAVKREVKEETGLNFKPTKVLGVYSLIRKNHPVRKDDLHAIKIIFSGEIIGDIKINFDPEEILEAKWFTIKELEAIRDKLRDKDIINAAKDCLANKGYPLSLIKQTVSDENGRK